MTSWKGLVAVGTLLCFGCASSYTPRPSPYLVPVELDGCSGYMRDGRCLAPGYWGDGAGALVQGVPAAEARMQTYASERTKRNAFALFGWTMYAGALGATIASRAGNADQSLTSLLTSFILVDVGLVSLIVAASYQSKSRRTLLESTNLYNQAVEERRCQPATGQPRPTTNP